MTNKNPIIRRGYKMDKLIQQLMFWGNVKLMLSDNDESMKYVENKMGNIVRDISEWRKNENTQSI